jgi:electron transfer flavoprotein alpha subunit
MKIAVCVKYIPVIARLKFDYEQKTVVREGVPSEVNPFDLLALVRAVELKRGPEDQVVVISMGPPQAKEGLMECLALGADRAVLLTDRALAGSDTLATARALSMALQREGPDLILCGRNSADAETGQVGPGIAELMSMPHVAPVRRLDWDAATNKIRAERIIDQGYQVIECSLPAVVCVTEGVAPELFSNREQMEEAQGKPLEELSCSELSSDLSQFGEAGSPTWVQDIRMLEPDRLGVTIEGGDPQEAAQQIAQGLRDRLAQLASQEEGADGPAPASERYPDDVDRSIWVVAESFQGELLQVTLEMLGKARSLTSVTKSQVVAVIVGGKGQTEAATRQLADYGADKVMELDNSQSGPIYGRAVSGTLAAAISQARPYAVLFAATADGRDLAARIAARLELGLTGDAIDLEIDDEGRLVQLKPALGGNVVAPILSKTLPNLVTIRPGLLIPITPEPGTPVNLETIEPLPAKSGSMGADVDVIEEHYQEDIGATELARATVVMGVGMGIGGLDGLAEARTLAGSIGAVLGTTRDVTHEGWLPHQVQIGISGRSIAPKVYLAVGIRGAFNHTVGVQRAGVIVAINSNRRAAIFRSADYGIIGDWREYLPALVEALKPVLEEAFGASSR